jgi:hypothetical protein
VVLYLSSQREPLKSEKVNIAGWSSLVARRAHNPKVVGSNPAPATTKHLEVFQDAFLLFIFMQKSEPLQTPSGIASAMPPPSQREALQLPGTLRLPLRGSWRGEAVTEGVLQQLFFIYTM